MTTTTGSSQQTCPEDRLAAGSQPRRLVRVRDGRMLAGVASGLAGYLGVDVLIVRIIIVVLALAGGAAVPLYLACWLLIPDEGSEQSIATEFTQDMQTWRH